MNTAFRKSVLVGIAGLSVAGTAAGCAPSAQAPAAQGAPPASESAAGTGSYKDGTYSADGNYTSPNGTETVGVELTLAGGAVSDVKITQHPSNPNTRKFQGEFAERHPVPGGGQEARRDQGFQSGRILADQRRLQPGRGGDQDTGPVARQGQRNRAASGLVALQL